ncbi:MAG TPA: hypothetical protein VGB85_31155, partial [Nannocystis sp.]
MSRSAGPRIVGVALALAASPVLAAPAPLQAGDLAGENRSLLRDVDRTRTNVAGEADAAAVVANPANMSFLKAIGGVIEGSWTRASAQRRGSGAGAYLAIPLSLRLFGRSVADNFLALGVGYQHLRPVPGTRLDGYPRPIDDRQAADMPYHKLSLSLAVPLMRWVPGLSLGLSYSRLWSVANRFADDLDQFDLALAYRPHRVVALGVVARAINTPHMGTWLGDAGGGAWPILRQAAPFELDPEIAVRPIHGTRALELAVGARIAPLTVFDRRFMLPTISPRVRIEGGGRGVRGFVEAERYWSSPESFIGSNVNGLRVMAG